MFWLAKEKKKRAWKHEKYVVAGAQKTEGQRKEADVNLSYFLIHCFSSELISIEEITVF